MSIYLAKIAWQNDSPETFTKNQYSRAHTWSFDGGVTVPASSSPHAVPEYSVESAVDPEEAFVASISSCHMLTFLWIASRKGYVVESYLDNAVGTLAKDGEGRMSMTEVKLRPEITWARNNVPGSDEIAAMHHAAHDGCYIANSVRSEITVETVQSGGA